MPWTPVLPADEDWVDITDWLLAFGFWDDPGVWVDGAVWRDNPFWTDIAPASEVWT